MNDTRYPPDSATQLKLLADLKLLTQEDASVIVPDCGGCTLCGGADDSTSAMFDDAQLTALLDANDWNLRRTAYSVLLQKAQASDIRFPSGLTLPDTAQYYLRLARQVRPNRSCTVSRADGV